MDLGELRRLIDEYASTLDDKDDSLECWGLTHREFAENELEPFYDWLMEKKLSGFT